MSWKRKKLKRLLLMQFRRVGTYDAFSSKISDMSPVMVALIKYALCSKNFAFLDRAAQLFGGVQRVRDEAWFRKGGGEGGYGARLPTVTPRPCNSTLLVARAMQVSCAMCAIATRFLHSLTFPKKYPGKFSKY